MLSRCEADYHYDVMPCVFLNRIEAAIDTIGHNAHYYSKTKKVKMIRANVLPALNSLNDVALLLCRENL